MKRFFTTMLLVFFLSSITANLAYARPHHHRAGHSHRQIYHDGRPSAWCGFWMSIHVFGHSVRSLWLASNWAKVGNKAPGPAPGVIGVMPHHVFKVLSVVRPGRVIAISGNDGGRVRTRERSTGGVIAWRML